MSRSAHRRRWLLGVPVAAALAAVGVWAAGPGLGGTARDGTSAPDAASAPDVAEPGAAAPSAAPAGATEVTPPASPDDVATDPAPTDPGPTGTADPVGSVDVVQIFAGWEETSGAVEAGGFVAGVVESGGTCRLTLTSGAESVVAEVPGEADASTTVCGGLAVDGGQLSAGTWESVLSYESPTGSGASSTVEVEVPAR